ncbi:MAG: hypothetical protein JW966_09195 [Anaerolineae bacterium]|nr:hypothetical protein [Anaerolineae bacterium]
MPGSSNRPGLDSRHRPPRRYWCVLVALALSLLAPLVPARESSLARAQKFAPHIEALAAIVLPGETDPAGFGVYLGHGLILTNWHPWTLDGSTYTSSKPSLSPSRQVPHYDNDGQDDPGEALLNMATCDGTWVPLADADPACTPFAHVDGAGFVFPMVDYAQDTTGSEPDIIPIPVQRLIYASRDYDIALFEVDAQAVEARGVPAARLSMAAPGAEHPVVAAYWFPGQSPAGYSSVLKTGAPALLPESDRIQLSGPWRVPSLVMTPTPVPLPHGAPVFCGNTGDLLGLTWREGPNAALETWVTPAAEWIHALFRANTSIRSDALAAVLENATTAPVDGAPTLGDPLAPGLGNSGIDVEHYTLDLAFDVEQGTLAGAATLDIRAVADHLATFSLDAHNLTIESITIDGRAAPFVAKDHKLFIELPEPVAFGTAFQVVITYQAAPEPFRSPYMPFFDIGMSFDKQQVSVLNEPDAAHTWFPCNDHPSDRASYDFLLRVHAPLDAVANGHLIETILHEDGTQTFHWRMNYPMATYLVTVAVADYIALEDQTPGGVLIRHYVYPDSVDAGREVFSYTGEALVMLEDLFGPYPYDTYGHVVVPQVGMALETQTMTTMPDDVLSLGERGLYALLVHELAHQWFGNTVTPETWADIWLNEGFATYAEWLGQEQRFGYQAAIATRSYSELSLISDNRQTPLMAPAPADTFGIASYDKGAWLLHMLRTTTGDETFFTLLQTYAQTFRDRPADSLDFWRLAEAISGQDLDWFFEQWLMQGDMPRYKLFWSISGSDGVDVDILLCPTTSSSYRLDLPLVFSNDDHSTAVTLSVDHTTTHAALTLDFVPITLVVDPEQTILAQVQMQPIAELPAECLLPGSNKGGVDQTGTPPP